MLERDVQKVAAATGGVEHAHAAQAVVEGAQFGGCGIHRGALLALQRVELARLQAHCQQAFAQLGGLLRVHAGGGAGDGPLLAQGLDDGGQHQALDIGARGVVGAELVALGGVERALQQGAEDGRFDIAPVGARGFDQQLDLGPVERQCGRVLEQLAVEVQHVGGERGREAAAVHVAPELGEHAHGSLGAFDMAAQQVAEALGRQQAHVLGKHGEQAAHQELGDGFGRVAAGFQAARELGQLGGDLAGDAGGLARGVQPHRVQPDAAQACEQLRPAQIGERDAVAARIGEGRVGGARARELAVQLDALAHIDHQHEGRAALAGRQGSGIGLSLAARAQKRMVEALGRERTTQLLRLQHEGAAAIQVDAPGAVAAIAVAEADRPLEHVVLLGRGVRGVDAEQVAEVDQKALRGRQLGGIDAVPLGDESLDRGEIEGVRIGAHAGGRKGIEGEAARMPRLGAGLVSPRLGIAGS
ncbi:hypothetical protein SAMN04488509_104180 [Aquimonas voraii]|uniref:Uncharacterized protein n=1 Tax=Aquimonas voraii TaxID=265719 RepID=A0A1G6W825_9GAMM|nr:hypothetical protein SAMN04488509_104180 [Aquimonas voraii]